MPGFPAISLADYRPEDHTDEEVLGFADSIFHEIEAHPVLGDRTSGFWLAVAGMNQGFLSDLERRCPGTIARKALHRSREIFPDVYRRAVETRRWDFALWVEEWAGVLNIADKIAGVGDGLDYDGLLCDAASLSDWPSCLRLMDRMLLRRKGGKLPGRLERTTLPPFISCSDREHEGRIHEMVLEFMNEGMFDLGRTCVLPHHWSYLSVIADAGECASCPPDCATRMVDHILKEAGMTVLIEEPNGSYAGEVVSRFIGKRPVLLHLLEFIDRNREKHPEIIPHYLGEVEDGALAAPERWLLEAVLGRRYIRHRGNPAHRGSFLYAAFFLGGSHSSANFIVEEHADIYGGKDRLSECADEILYSFIDDLSSDLRDHKDLLDESDGKVAREVVQTQILPRLFGCMPLFAVSRRTLELMESNGFQTDLVGRYMEDPETTSRECFSELQKNWDECKTLCWI